MTRAPNPLRTPASAPAQPQQQQMIPAQQQAQLPATVQAPLPAHLTLAEGQSDGLEILNQYVQPPRVKIVQPLSGEPFNAHPAGTVLSVGGAEMKVIAEIGFDSRSRRSIEDGNPFYFVSLFFFPEYCAWNDFKLKGTVPAIRERSTDPNSEVAKRAKSPALREENDPEHDKMKIRYVEHLNHIIMLYHPDFWGTPHILSFARAEHKSGCNFAGLVRMRRAPLFGCNWQGATKYRDNGKGQWYGWNMTNPQITDPNIEGYISPWVEDATMSADFQALHETYKDIHRRGLLQTVYDEDDGGAIDAGAPLTPEQLAAKNY